MTLNRILNSQYQQCKNCFPYDSTCFSSSLLLFNPRRPNIFIGCKNGIFFEYLGHTFFSNVKSVKP